MVNWDKIKYFYHAASHLSFTKAAEILNTSQPVISKHIKDLESRLKITLFTRTSRGLSLTPHGEKLLNSAQKMFEGFEDFDNFNTENDQSLTRELTISTSPGVSATWLPKHITKFLELYPEMRLNIRAGQTITSIEGNEAHLRAFIPNNEGLTQRYLTTFYMNLYASQGYLEKFGEPKNISDLDNHQLFMYGEKLFPLRGNTNWALTKDTLESNRKPFLKANSEATLFAFAKENLGIVELPEGYPGLKESKLVKLFPSYTSPEIKLYYIHLKSHQRNERINTFGDFLESQLKC